MGRNVVNCMALIGLVGVGLVSTGCCAGNKAVTFTQERGAEDADLYSVELSCPLFVNKEVCAGFKHVHNKDWGLAIERLEPIAKTGEGGYFCYLVLAVSFEKLEDYESALYYYKRANWEKQTEAAANGIERVRWRVEG